MTGRRRVGDTWYAGGSPPVELDRPFRDRGVPPRFKAYDRAFLRWLRRPDVRLTWSADDDLEAFATVTSSVAIRSRRLPGHSEYMTVTPTTWSSAFATSAAGSSSSQRTTSSGRTRSTARRFVGSSSGATTAGPRHASPACSTAPTTTAGDRALHRHRRRGRAMAPRQLRPRHRVDVRRVHGGYGIEIDTTSSDSPPGTILLARIVHLLGPG